LAAIAFDTRARLIYQRIVFGASPARSLLKVLGLVTVLAVSIPRQAQGSGGWPGPEAVVVAGFALTSPLVLGGLGIANLLRANGPPSFGWGCAQALVPIPYALAGLVLTGVAGMAAVEPSASGEPKSTKWVAVGLVGGVGLAMAAISGIFIYRGTRELLAAVDEDDAKPASSTSALHLVPALVGVDERGPTAWGFVARGTF
jgi:hypothetical protein